MKDFFLDKSVHCVYIWSMVTIGVRNLRNSLSMYIDMVKNGETVLITDHNKIVAELNPAGVYAPKVDLLQEYVSEQAAGGSIIRANQNIRLSKKYKGLKNNDADRIYKETRSDR